jgi:hypothetical protein
VIVVETRARLLGRREAGWVAAGLSVSIGTAVVYVTKLSAGPWLTHIDIAHLSMGVSFALIARGARSCPRRIGRGAMNASPTNPPPAQTSEEAPR